MRARQAGRERASKRRRRQYAVGDKCANVYSLKRTSQSHHFNNYTHCSATTLTHANTHTYTTYTQHPGVHVLDESWCVVHQRRWVAALAMLGDGGRLKPNGKGKTSNTYPLAATHAARSALAHKHILHYNTTQQNGPTARRR